MSTEPRAVSYQPTAGLSYDPSEPVYWDARALRGEIDRVFEVCHGCRMCFKFCDSFPDLFRFIDERHGGDAHALDDAEVDAVMASCFQCKLCEVQCPYTPRDGHEFQLDFPALVHRYRAVRRREGAARWRERLRARLLGDPDLTGRLVRASFGLANVVNRWKPARVLLEKLLGVHRDKELPPFAREPFHAWARREGLVVDPEALPALPADETPEVVLFQTCYVEHNEPEIGRDTIEVLRKSGVRVACVEGLLCCGMPAWESGDLERLRANARRNLDRLIPFVERGAQVVAINPTCAMTLRREWPTLLEGADRERATRLAAAVRDPGESLWSLREAGRFCEDFRTTPAGPVAYHAPCHLRAQAVGFRSRDLLRRIPGVQPRPTMECCGHDGTFAMKVEGFEPSRRIGEKAFDGMRRVEAEVWASDCPLAAIQFRQHAGKKALHPMSVLARAYREDGFPTRVEEIET